MVSLDPLTSMLMNIFNAAFSVSLSPWLSFAITAFFALNSAFALLIMSVSPVFLIISIYIVCIDNAHTIYKYIYDFQNPMTKIYNVADLTASQSAFICCISPFAIIALNGISRYAVQVLYFYDTPTIQINQYVADAIVSFDWILNPKLLFMILLLITLYVALITVQKTTNATHQFIMYAIILSMMPLFRMSIDIYNIQNNASISTAQYNIFNSIISGEFQSSINSVIHTLCPSQDTAVYAAMDDLQESILQIAQKVVGGLESLTLNAQNLKDALSQDSSTRENLSKKLAQLDIAKLRYPKTSIYSDAIADEIQIVRSAIR